MGSGGGFPKPDGFGKPPSLPMVPSQEMDRTSCRPGIQNRECTFTGRRGRAKGGGGEDVEAERIFVFLVLAALDYLRECRKVLNAAFNLLLSEAALVGTVGNHSRTRGVFTLEMCAGPHAGSATLGVINPASKRPCSAWQGFRAPSILSLMFLREQNRTKCSRCKRAARL